jgi:predicted enzyme related to lactoylglutathione lyase
MSDPVVHLELHTGNLARACAFYTRLFDWKAESIGSYLALGLGRDGFQGGVVENGVSRSLWLPYVQVDDVARATARARELGGTVALEPREGAAGWRSVIAAPAGAGVALWQPKNGL